MSALEAVTAGPLAVDDLVTLARDAIANSKAPSTLRAYRSDWGCFESWCSTHRLEALPAEPATVCLYLVDRAQTRKASTLQRRLASIAAAHKGAGLLSPTTDPNVRATMSGLRRTLGEAFSAQHGKAPLLTEHVRRIAASLDPSRPHDVRDRALLLVGFAGGLRRSELAALDWRDLTEDPDGLRITLRRSKTDQEARGRTVGIPYGSHPATCPVRAVRAWGDLVGLRDGPVFRPIGPKGEVWLHRVTPWTVADVVKRRARAIGLDPATFAGHSLRSGMATSAARAGATERSIMRQTGHRSVAMVRRYIDDGSIFESNAAASLGL